MVMRSRSPRYRLRALARVRKLTYDEAVTDL
jgi:hypothetical protein